MSSESELGIDYEAAAELYFPASMGRAAGINYRRFATVSLALDFVFGSLTGARLAAAALEVNGTRYTAIDMRRLQAERPVA